MQIFLTLAFLFFIGSIAGWIMELFYRRTISGRKWINPGMLVRTIFTTIWIWNMHILSFIKNRFK